MLVNYRKDGLDLDYPNQSGSKDPFSDVFRDITIGLTLLCSFIHNYVKVH